MVNLVMYIYYVKHMKLLVLYKVSKVNALLCDAKKNVASKNCFELLKHTILLFPH
jgi:hypothetical protein